MTADSLAWSLVIPVKVLARAKSRLTELAGPRRPELALALAADTVSAAASCPEVAAVIVVSDDPAAAAELTGLGALVIADEPDAGLNPALVHGAATAAALHPGAGTGALAADLPALRPDELGRALRAAARWPEAFVPDAAGSGTTLYTAMPGSRFQPRFGPGSRMAHRNAGAAELDISGIASVRRDVDTPGDLNSASQLGLGRRTAPIAAQLLGPGHG
ncbi:MAG TPA: 2-phospho-L-lactate guanylyltransferase [Streptosporangiaceae bacterium]|jgi:2-phospho-L-lactate guanylyltransferase|nr:2-phospho-L-lactate guanylyltransferase [Streptosporangiaceae bacterium]